MDSYFTIDSSRGPILGVFQNQIAVIDAVISIRAARLFGVTDTPDEDLTVTEWNGTQMFSSLSWEEVDQACLDRITELRDMEREIE